ncbi:zinc ribbon domain-containing protein [Spirochaeta africana]|uniref:DZANK-type domain-containing protein n=1 Tax=Spirochaeta africana (strain ATCC 700263 / DSM 8902 / Z-7692) TaxID=889378 RepID=H9UJQ0_SPIAZ|nr:zinc ribbon domain-containing protein [Spirochaeta africana]AFG37743.1 hypothetical protein Spiaf_1686 [Spirochaeta africana DSM 8902]
MKHKKHPKFFCENCGTDVPASAMMCPVCGRFFAAVRCPRCSYSGRQAEFKNGCPRCGYSGVPDTSAGSAGSEAQDQIRLPRKTRPLLPLFPSILITMILAFIGLVIIYMQL